MQNTHFKVPPLSKRNPNPLWLYLLPFNLIVSYAANFTRQVLLQTYRNSKPADSVHSTWQLWVMPGYSIQASFAVLLYACEGKNKPEDKGGLVPLPSVIHHKWCNFRLGCLTCGGIKLAGLCLNNCTAMATGKSMQVCQPAFGSPLCTPCWHW